MVEPIQIFHLDISTDIPGVVAFAQQNRLDGLLHASPQTFTVYSDIEAFLLREQRENARQQGLEMPTSLD